MIVARKMMRIWCRLIHHWWQGFIGCCLLYLLIIYSIANAVLRDRLEFSIYRERVFDYLSVSGESLTKFHCYVQKYSSNYNAFKSWHIVFNGFAECGRWRTHLWSQSIIVKLKKKYIIVLLCVVEVIRINISK